MADTRHVQDFEGTWQITRQITSADGTTARFEGQAVWTPHNGGLAYVEWGQMVLTGATPMHAERRYFWAQDLAVFFEDGRYFHHVPARGGSTEHWCDPDTYKGHYDFADWPRFRVTWQVTGPRKDYNSVTDYQRS